MAMIAKQLMHRARLDFSRRQRQVAFAVMVIAIVLSIGLLKADGSQGGTSPPTGKTETAAPNPSIAPLPEFEVVSIKPNKSGKEMMRLMHTPNGFSAIGVTLEMLVRYAYGVQNFQISGAPGWLSSDKYDINARIDSSVSDAFKKLSQDESRLEQQRMLQKLLTDRCKLAVHTETKDLPVYRLVIAKNGPKLREAKPGDTYPNGFTGPEGRPGSGMMRMSPTQLTAQGVAMTPLVAQLSQQLGRTVIDKTGLTGKYDYTLQWAPEEREGGSIRASEGGTSGPDTAALPESSGPSIFTALQEQLGLKLESDKGPVEIVVIDHVERPSEN